MSVVPDGSHGERGRDSMLLPVRAGPPSAPSCGRGSPIGEESGHDDAARVAARGGVGPPPSADHSRAVYADPPWCSASPTAAAPLVSADAAGECGPNCQQVDAERGEVHTLEVDAVAEVAEVGTADVVWEVVAEGVEHLRRCHLPSASAALLAAIGTGPMWWKAGACNARNLPVFRAGATWTPPRTARRRHAASLRPPP